MKCFDFIRERKREREFMRDLIFLVMLLLSIDVIEFAVSNSKLLFT